jgi:flagellar basal body-associated protein FliL
MNKQERNKLLSKIEDEQKQLRKDKFIALIALLTVTLLVWGIYSIVVISKKSPDPAPVQQETTEEPPKVEPSPTPFTF